MIIAAIIVGILLVFFIILSMYTSDKKKSNYDTGVVIGFIICGLFVLEVGLLSDINEDPQPTAMDVYQGKTTLEYKVVDNIKVDSIVILKNDEYGK